MNITQSEYLVELKTWANGERMVPEAFVGGIDNVYSHFCHWLEASKRLVPGKRVLDVGCGCGLPARIYSIATNSEVVAIDKPEAIKWSRILYPTPGVTFVEVDLANGFDVGKFDNIVCIDVIEHIEQSGYDVFLRSLGNSGTAEARWILSVPIRTDEDKNVWHKRSWKSREEFLLDVSRFIPKDRILLF